MVVQEHQNIVILKKIVKAFSKELVRKGEGVESYCISDCSKWEEIKDAYIRNTEIIIAMPLYVECVPGILLEFLGTLPVKDNGFSREVAKKFAGPDYYPLPLRILLGIMFKTTFVKKMEGVASSLDCTKPLNYRPWS